MKIADLLKKQRKSTEETCRFCGRKTRWFFKKRPVPICARCRELGKDIS